VQRWKAPPGEWHKCNVDGAFFTSCNSGSTGAILRDLDGRFMAGRATRYNLACNALMMEALACRDGIQMAQELRITKLCFETDCLKLINLWKALDMQRSAVSLIIHDIRCISRSFSEFTFICANRTCNRVAHECARQVSHKFDRVE
jgi:ribonuclease HI